MASLATCINQIKFIKSQTVQDKLHGKTIKCKYKDTCHIQGGPPALLTYNSYRNEFCGCGSGLNRNGLASTKSCDNMIIKVLPLASFKLLN